MLHMLKMRTQTCGWSTMTVWSPWVCTLQYTVLYWQEKCLQNLLYKLNISK